jgi:hypothetical protein
LRVTFEDHNAKKEYNRRRGLDNFDLDLWRIYSISSCAHFAQYTRSIVFPMGKHSDYFSIIDLYVGAMNKAACYHFA